MDPSTWLELVSTLALSGGLIFAAVEWRATGRERTRQSQIMLLRSFDSPAFTRAMRVVMDMPEGRSKSEIDASPETADLVWYWLGVTEQVGMLVNVGELDLKRVDETIGGPIMIGWAKLGTYVADGRRQYGREAMYEYGQWLVEHLTELERDEGRVPAYRSAG